ncbi:MAG TPA: MlaD family protein [Terriglobia bacterium]|nr:MlaD family protein [Terriglobia bacterium]
MEPNRERVFVGVFVLIAAALLSVTVLALRGGFRGSGVTYRAFFTFVGGLEPGTPVRYGGLKVGRVERVRVDPQDSTRIEVEFVVSRDTPLKTDSVAKITSLGLLSDNYVELSVGTNRSELARPGATLRSVEPFGIPQIGESVQSLVPQIEVALQKLNQNLDGLQITIARANDLLNDGNRSNIRQALERTNDLLNDRNRSSLSASLDSVNQMIADARPKVDASLTNFKEATVRMAPLLDDIRKTTGAANEMLAHLDSVLIDNRADLKASVLGLRDALAKSTTVINKLEGIMDQNTANVDEMLENIRLSSENIRSLTDSVKRNPASLIRGVNVKERKPGEIEK